MANWNPGNLVAADAVELLPAVIDRLKRFGFLENDFELQGGTSRELLLKSLQDARFEASGQNAPVLHIDRHLLNSLLVKKCRAAAGKEAPPPQSRETAWPNRRISFSIGNMALLNRKGLNESAIRGGVRLAAMQWNQVCSMALEEVASEPDILIEAVSPDPHPVGEQIAHADYPGDNNLFGFPLLIHLDSRESWTLGSEPFSYDLVRTVMHGLGHCLGLFHYPGTLMNPTIYPEDDQRSIEPVIQDRILDLYPIET
ncbi:MAG: matrixin family metalloprotease [Planctomycetota bacterium]|nr:matrixin family metalloprotease [Planctomycetota bacterium]